jgi:glyoxylase-like metal-dependent hydrolase (beta-lactamase superfamily II)
LQKTLTDKTETEIAKVLEDNYGIYKIPIVSRMFGFIVNSFFVQKLCPTLVDVPPDERIYLEKLQAGLAKTGYSLADIRRIVVTHPHFDHFGAARTISEISGAEVWVAGEGAHWFEDFEREIHAEETARSAFLLEAGASRDEIREVDDYYSRATPLARSLEPARRLNEGDLFDLSAFQFTITSVPGHTPWCVLLHDVENKVAFSGDFLQTITSNPLIQRNAKTLPSYNSLKSYVKSLEKIDAAGLQITLPGHGDIIMDGSERAKQILALIRRRRKAVLHFLEESEQTSVSISHGLFPDLLPGRLFNAVSEVTAHLELLEEDRLVQRVGEHPARFFAL